MSISKEQAIEAIKTVGEYCRRTIPDSCLGCKLYSWCRYEKSKSPYSWEVPND